MQLTSPAFLLIFLPLSLPIMLLTPKKHRSAVLALLSALWYILANRDNPAGICAVFGLVLFAYAMVLPSADQLPRIRLLFGTVLPLCLLLAARLFAEYGPDEFLYPYGLTFVVLGAVSAVIDRLRGDGDRPRGFLDFAAYLLFFPCLLMGPVVRYKHFRELSEGAKFSLSRVSDGIRLYMSGTIKRVAVAAVLWRSLAEIVDYCEGELHYITALVLPIIAFFCLRFFIEGCSELSRGVACMLGVALPRDQGNVLFSSDPFKFFLGGGYCCGHRSQRYLCDCREDLQKTPIKITIIYTEDPKRLDKMIEIRT